MITVILLSIATLLPPSVVVTERCDIVEVNHVYTDTGSHTLSQVIWWEWCKDFDRYNVIDWRMIEACGKPTQIGRKYVNEWYDNKTRSHLRVIAYIYKETWTLYDPEIKAREVYPEVRRRKLK